jgi:hypothetical protein
VWMAAFCVMSIPSRAAASSEGFLILTEVSRVGDLTDENAPQATLRGERLYGPGQICSSAVFTLSSKIFELRTADGIEVSDIRIGL